MTYGLKLWLNIIFLNFIYKLNKAASLKKRHLQPPPSGSGNDRLPPPPSPSGASGQRPSGENSVADDFAKRELDRFDSGFRPSGSFLESLPLSSVVSLRKRQFFFRTTTMPYPSPTPSRISDDVPDDFSNFF